MPREALAEDSGKRVSELGPARRAAASAVAAASSAAAAARDALNIGKHVQPEEFQRFRISVDEGTGQRVLDVAPLDTTEPRTRNRCATVFSSQSNTAAELSQSFLEELSGTRKTGERVTWQERASAADYVANLASGEKGKGTRMRDMIITAGAVELLIECLKSPQPEVQVAGANALANLAIEPDNEAVIREAGGMTNLTPLLRSPNEDVSVA